MDHPPSARPLVTLLWIAAPNQAAGKASGFVVFDFTDSKTVSALRLLNELSITYPAKTVRILRFLSPDLIGTGRRTAASGGTGKRADRVREDAMRGGV